MTSEIKVPTLPESIADALIVTWHKKEGDPVRRDEVLVDIETDKVVMEVPASEDGVLGKILETEGTTVSAHQVIGSIEAAGAEAAPSSAGGSDTSSNAGADDTTSTGSSAAATADATVDDSASSDDMAADAGQTGPSVRRLLEKHSLQAVDVQGSGRHGRILKDDVERHVAAHVAAQGSDRHDASASQARAEETSAPQTRAPAPSAPSGGSGSTPLPIIADGERVEKRVPMSRLRARIAERLLSATQNTAMLTTFNEVDMSAFIALRNQYKDRFEKSHGVKLGFMSIFLKAATESLKRFPDINASIDGSDVIYHGYCDIGVAVSSDRGLVVPVLRNTENMTLADIEKTIGHYAEKARDGKLSIEEMTGGTFTVSNGGVFGSLLSTPILNPPQSAILGMHATQDRPIALNGQVVIRPMMYIALSYDHRIVDGKGAVGFLKTIKELVEDPARIVFDL